LKAPKQSVPETSAPNPCVQNIDGSPVILQGFSKWVTLFIFTSRREVYRKQL
jgi:hypothetical protein